MKNAKRTALVLALLTAGIAVSACGDTGNDGSVTTAANDGTAAVTEAVSELSEEDSRRAVSDNIPEMDFEGAPFRTITQDSTVNDIWVEAETGDVLDDAIYGRNRRRAGRCHLRPQPCR